MKKKSGILTRRQADVLVERRAFGDALRALFQSFTPASQPMAPGHGVDRVPARLRGLAVTVELHHDSARLGTYRNPARKARLAKSGRLRRDLAEVDA